MRYITTIAVSFLLFMSFATCQAIEPQEEQDPGERVAFVWFWDSQDDFDQCTRNQYLDSLSTPGEVKLVHNMVITDDMGAGYNDFQSIRGKTQARKILMLDDPDVVAATLLVGGKVNECEILVNGQALKDGPLDSSYWHADFERYVVSPELLKQGANEFIFRTRNGKGEGKIRIERSQQPDRSAVSRDGGHLWDADHLAEGGYMNGELQVRLNVARYAPEAWLQSPVLDLASAVLAGGIPAGETGRIDELLIDAEVEDGTGVKAFVRTGTTPDGYEENWTRWYSWPMEKENVEFGRFAQWRIVLTTEEAQKTPIVRGISLRASAIRSPEDATFKSVQLLEGGNERIMRSSYQFAYGDYDRNLKVLREHWKLADVVAEAETEIEKLKVLRQWVRDQWSEGWTGKGGLDYCPSWDARVILTMAPSSLSMGMCTHYATTFVQCSQALGYTARSVFRGHALSESWSNEHKKWIVMDAGMDPNDRRRATYHIMRDGIPLNELEVHKAYFIDKKWDDIEIVTTNMSVDTDNVEEPFAGDLEEFLKNTQQMFIPLRNNFIDHREPEEPEHGMGYFKFMRHLFWKDKATPDIPWTDLFTTREADLYWTINQAQIFLHPGKRGDGALRVMLDTVTPNFAGYEYRIDGGEWIAWHAKEQAGKTNATDVKAFPMKSTGGCIEFPWKLRPGRNTIEARPFSKAALRGIVSKIVMEATE